MTNFFAGDKNLDRRKFRPNFFWPMRYVIYELNYPTPTLISWSTTSMYTRIQQISPEFNKAIIQKIFETNLGKGAK